MYSDQNVIEIDDDEHHNTTKASFEFQENKPRQIIFCIDVSVEMNVNMQPSANTGVKDSNLYYSSRLETIQRFIKRYTRLNKLIGNKQDEYGIVTLSDEASWWVDFSKDISRFDYDIDFLDSQVTNKYDSFDTLSLFNTIAQFSNLQDDAYFTHVIVIYARTDVLPSQINRGMYSGIRNASNFTMDVIFLHDQTDSVQNIYDFWNDLDCGVNPGWYYETANFHGKEKITKALAELVAHPLQRGDQETISQLK